MNQRVPYDVGITWHDCIHRGKVACIPRVLSNVSKINTGTGSSYDQFLKVHACKLWNCLPKHVNYNCKASLESFKETLDSFLSGIPDFPPEAGYSAANSNSLLDSLSTANAYQIALLYYTINTFITNSYLLLKCRPQTGLKVERAPFMWQVVGSNLG